MPEWIWPTVVSVLVASLGAASAMLLRMGGRIRDLELDMVAVKLKGEPYWAVAQQILSKKLTHKGHPRVDELLVRLNALTITQAEKIELKNLLNERLTDFTGEITADERACIPHFLWIMDQVILEKESATLNLTDTAIIALFGISSALGNALRNWR
jgi:hypothetical protein